MRRLICLLLIPLCLFGSLAPLSHCGTGVVEQSGHSARPHVHLESGHTRHHVHASPERIQSAVPNAGAAQLADGKPGTPFIDPIADHDSDALYLTSVTLDSRRQQVQPTVESMGLPIQFDEIAWIQALHSLQQPIVYPPDAGVALPIYLRIASLRI